MKKGEMTPKERVLYTLGRETPDKVPWVEDGIAPLAVYPHRRVIGSNAPL